ncbi:histone-lysine N-methyltransferase SETMAR [Trichonephila clavipes]|nr:histone-lysine N-methyltransferase SETMAR [Trichonephila clavipes]
MVSQIPEEIHVHRYMLLEFHKGSNATVATKNICDVFPSALDVHEKWVLYDNPKRKRQWLSPNESPRRTTKPGLHPKKALLCVWWGIRGIVHFEVLKPGETVNSDLYCEQLDRLNQSLIENYPAIINRRGVVLQHDNVRPQCARKTPQKINGLGWEVLPHPPYSPDIAPTDFHLFRSNQHFLTNKKFQNFDDMKNAISRYFTEKPIDFYRSSFENLHARWQKVVANEGDYIID